MLLDQWKKWKNIQIGDKCGTQVSTKFIHSRHFMGWNALRSVKKWKNIEIGDKCGTHEERKNYKMYKYAIIQTSLFNWSPTVTCKLITMNSLTCYSKQQLINFWKRETNHKWTLRTWRICRVMTTGVRETFFFSLFPIDGHLTM